MFWDPRDQKETPDLKVHPGLCRVPRERTVFQVYHPLSRGKGVWTVPQGKWAKKASLVKEVNLAKRDPSESVANQRRAKDFMWWFTVSQQPYQTVLLT